MWICWSILIVLGSVSGRVENSRAGLSSECPAVENCVCSRSQDEFVAECSGQELDELPEGLPETITELHLQNTSIKMLSSGEFSTFGQLKVITIQDTPLGISSGAFDGLPNLRHLAMERCRLKADIFQNGILDVLESLEELILSHNNINEIKEKSFEKMSNLEELDLRHNQINSIGRNTFFKLNKLKTLLLADNNIIKMADYFCDYLTSLEVLDLSRNSIGKEKIDDAFADCKGIKTLLLSQNSISAVPTRMFFQMDNLRILNLDKNLITSIPTDAFQHLPKLEQLSLDVNNVLEVPERAFDRLPLLTNLHLSNQPNLQALDEQALRGIPRLTMLYLQGNPRLNVLKPVHVHNLDSLKSIHIYDNNFRTLDGEIFLKRSHLSSALIHGNPFECDCSLRWIPNAVTSEETWAVDWLASSTAPRCALPEHLARREIAPMLPVDLTCEKAQVTAESALFCLEEGDIAIMKADMSGGLPFGTWVTPGGKFIRPTSQSAHIDTGEKLQPPPSEIAMFRSRMEVTETLDPVTHNVMTTFTIHDVTVEDTGKYTLIATNGQGNATKNFDLEVKDSSVTAGPSGSVLCRASRSHVTSVFIWVILTLCLVS